MPFVPVMAKVRRVSPLAAVAMNARHTARTQTTLFKRFSIDLIGEDLEYDPLSSGGSRKRLWLLAKRIELRSNAHHREESSAIVVAVVMK